MKTVNDKNLIEEVYEYDVILFAMGVNNSLKTGFNNHIAVNFPDVALSEGRYRYGDRRKIGTVHETECDGVRFVACYIKRPELKKKKDDCYLDYEALEKCLEEVKARYGKMSVASPILGADEMDGNGDKERIVTLFEKHLPDVTLYDFKQDTFYDVMFKKIKHITYKLKHHLLDPEEYERMRRIFEWRKLHGIYSEVPDEFKTPTNNRKKRKITVNKNGVDFKY